MNERKFHLEIPVTFNKNMKGTWEHEIGSCKKKYKIKLKRKECQCINYVGMKTEKCYILPEKDGRIFPGHYTVDKCYSGRKAFPTRRKRHVIRTEYHVSLMASHTAWLYSLFFLIAKNLHFFLYGFCFTYYIPSLMLLSIKRVSEQRHHYRICVMLS